MKNQWVTFFKGTVLVKAEGRGIERFINQLTRSGMAIWNVKRQGTMAVTFYMNLEDIGELRKQIRNHDCRIRFLRGSGAPFLWKRSLKNAGFGIGFLLFLAIITLLSNMIWGVEIKGASPKTEHQIRKELDKLGIRTGNFQFFTDDIESIQHQLTNRIPEATWIGVDLRGTTYHFTVVEKNTPKKAKKPGPRHLVASQKAVIEEMFVEKGKPVVKQHQYVKKGQLLVSGVIGNDKEKYPVAATGKVYGKTWYKSEVELPLKSRFQVYTGKEKRKYYLQIGSWKMPVWGFKNHTFTRYDTDEESRAVKFIKWDLPLHFIRRTVREKETIDRVYTKEQAAKEAKAMAKQDLRKKLPRDAKIMDEYILQEKLVNGTLNMMIYYQAVENIAIAKPIAQGDLE
ncbi:sporulation protein YqfD [Heyndrickxia acidiproducens]|uniref:sporulation protein YqfD n=1 Tax=Heyndrickxia acidiproducens TaxID=1121084 RepID=UPI0003824FF4|nr:sporulation protein YqfD [Heyndrickxia acidiproducens]